MYKKFNSHCNGFLRAEQDRAEKSCQVGWIGYAFLKVAQKAIEGYQFLA